MTSTVGLAPWMGMCCGVSAGLTQFLPVIVVDTLLLKLRFFFKQSNLLMDFLFIGKELRKIQVGFSWNLWRFFYSECSRLSYNLFLGCIVTSIV